MHFLVNLVLFSIPAICALAIAARLAKGSKDEWQVLAWLPSTPLLLWAVYVAWGITRDPTSHNLWPFELLIWVVVSSLLFAGFLLARKLFASPPPPWQRQGRT